MASSDAANPALGGISDRLLTPWCGNPLKAYEGPSSEVAFHCTVASSDAANPLHLTPYR